MIFAKRTWIAIFVLALNIPCIPVFAGFTPRVTFQPEPNGACIIVNKRIVVRLRTSNGNLSPVQRASLATERLAGLVQKGLNPMALSYKLTGQSARLMAGDVMIAIATPSEAKAQGTTPAKLASAWVQNIREALSLPPLSASPTELLIPIGETRTVSVESLLPEPVTAQVSNGAIVSADASKPGSLVIKGLQLGETEITLRCAEFSVIIKAHVKKYAAQIMSSATTVVTGSSVPISLTKQAAEDAARSAVILEPGAFVSSLSMPKISSSPLPGQRIQIPVEIEAKGGNHIPIRGTTQVHIENRPLSYVNASSIMYSNDPERIWKYQVLYTGKILQNQEATRLLYHHQNMMGRRIGFVVDILNPSTNSASLHLIEGVSPPMLDTVLVGYKAGNEFLENHRTMIGRIIELPKESRRVIVSQPLDHPYTASGIIEFRQLSGDPLIVRVIAKPESQRQIEDQPNISLPLDGIDLAKFQISDHIYPNPMQKMELTYSAGKPWVFFRIGKDALKNSEKDRWLFGNYGVIYDIKASLENPLMTSHTVEIAFEATAGIASGVFFVDGRPVRIKSLQPPQEICLDKITIPAGKTRTVSIRTMPLSGSAYPATLIIRPAGTTASASAAKPK